jgi:hypothetical protein
MIFPRLGPAHAWIRSNVLGMVAIFIALSGSAVAANAAGDHGSQASKAKASKGPRGPAGPPGAAGAQGPQGVQGVAGTSGLAGPPSGSAGGELTGSYPNPQVGTVAGLDLAENRLPAGGISFGPDTNLYRSAASLLVSDGSLGIGGDLTVGGRDVSLPADTIDGTEVDESSLGTVPNANALDGLDSSALQRQSQITPASQNLPNVAGVNVLWLRPNVDSTLDGLAGGTVGQVITLRADPQPGGATYVFDDGGAFSLAGNWTSPGTDDTLTLVMVSAGGHWLELSRSNN